MLPISTSVLNLELIKLWGNILTAAASKTAIPSSHFLQSIQILACNNDSIIDTSSLDSNSLLPVRAYEPSEDFPFSSEHKEIGQNTSRLLYEVNDDIDILINNDGHDVDSEDLDTSDDSCNGQTQNDKGGGYVKEEKAVVEVDVGGKCGRIKKCRIQRMRYGREEYKCSICPYHCTTEHAFIRHLRTVCAGNSTSQLKSILRNELHHSSNFSNPSIAAADTVSVSCCVCGSDKSGDLSLALHMQRHRLGKHFRCDLCHFQTLQLKKLIQHRRMHTGEKPHLCPHCPYRSARRDNLRSHVRRVHKKDNLFGDTFTPRCMLVTSTSSVSKANN